ncbi:MAG: SpoIID/LytB domain-containing protein [Eubacteriales bacterium]|nr:SpoIID/LytB domain-containing protein [Eubacteriales bacterium]
MKKKMLTFFILFSVLAIIMVIVEEYKNAKMRKDIATEFADEDTPATEEYYTYSDIAIDMECLADDEETLQEITRLVDPLSLSQPVTVGYMRQVISLTGLPESVFDHVISTESDDTYLSKEQYDAIFAAIVRSNVVDGLSRVEIFVLDVYENASDGMQYVYTGNETYSLAKSLPEEYKDHMIDAYVHKGMIFRVLDYGITTTSFHNAWLSDVNETSCTFLLGDIQKTYPIASDATTQDAVLDCKTNRVVSVTVGNEGVVEIMPQTDLVTVRINKVTDKGLQVNNHGTYSCSPDFLIYNCEGNVYCEDSPGILIGYPSVCLVLESGKVIAAVVEEALVCDDIRVILSNDDYSSYDMERVMLTCEGEFLVTDEQGEVTKHPAGDNLTLLAENYEEGDKFTIEPVNRKDCLQLTSIVREYGNPYYAGKIEVQVVAEHMLHIINIVPMEEYLYSVVASEMTSSCHPEALRALAICARGYAYTKLSDESFADYDAHLDDSTLCQMYNRVEATPQTKRAVKDTYGIVPTYEDTVILPLYFSTSSGMTCTNAEIWGGTAYEYLESNLETIDKEEADISDEDMFREFMDNSLGFDIIDKDQPYYRWTISYTKEDMTAAIDTMLSERLRVSPDSIKIKVSDDEYEVADIRTIGNVISVQVTERTPSGVVEELLIEGSEATICVKGQTNIRTLLTPVNQEIVRADGQIITGWTSLPSPFYYVEETNDGFVIHGGGFGHGVGMSQMGANVLAEAGYNYRYILRHYYSGIDFTTIYSAEDADTVDDATEDTN